MQEVKEKQDEVKEEVNSYKSKISVNNWRDNPQYRGLIPAKKGEVRNPKGRPKGGLVLIEWLNLMTAWDTVAIKAVIKDKSAPAAKIAAARVIIRAIAERGGADFDRWADRTVGKPEAHVSVSGQVEHSHTVLARQLDGLSVERLESVMMHMERLLAAEDAARVDTIEVEALPAPEAVAGPDQLDDDCRHSSHDDI